jgi:hypothetical protein
VLRSKLREASPTSAAKSLKPRVLISTPRPHCPRLRMKHAGNDEASHHPPISPTIRRLSLTEISPAETKITPPASPTTQPPPQTSGQWQRHQWRWYACIAHSGRCALARPSRHYPTRESLPSAPALPAVVVVAQRQQIRTGCLRKFNPQHVTRQQSQNNAIL